MRTFVMGDLHGAQRALAQCMKRSGFDRRKDVLIQLGDVADGHEEVYECVETLLTIPRLIAIRGNHDQWFLEFIETGYHPDAWHCGGAHQYDLLEDGSTDAKGQCVESGHRGRRGRQAYYHGCGDEEVLAE